MSCARCRGTGWLTKDDQGNQLRRENGRYARPCPCRSALLDRAQLEAAFRDAGLSRALITEALEPWAGTNPKPEALIEWAGEPATQQHPEPWCWYLFGRPGLGKTKAATMALGAWLRRRHRGAIFRRSALLVAQIMDDRRSDVRGFESAVSACPLLVVDDLGTERPDHSPVIDEIVARREADRLPTVLTSNASPANLESDRIASRLLSAELIEFGGVDMRDPEAA